MKKSDIRSKAEETTRAALEIIDAETEARNAKTARLRAQRAEREENDSPAK